jgi:hypothetical protein
MTARRTDGSIRPGSSPAEVVLGGLAEFERELVVETIINPPTGNVVTLKRTGEGP